LYCIFTKTFPAHPFSQVKQTGTNIANIYRWWLSGELGNWLQQKLNAEMEIVKQNEYDKWVVLPKMDSRTSIHIADELREICYGL
jgi:hypothetical protein